MTKTQHAILVIFLLIFGIGTVWYVTNNSSEKQTSTRPSADEGSSPVKTLSLKYLPHFGSTFTSTSDWVEYRNEEYNLKFKYPPSWIVDDKTTDVINDIRVTKPSGDTAPSEVGKAVDQLILSKTDGVCGSSISDSGWDLGFASFWVRTICIQRHQDEGLRIYMTVDSKKSVTISHAILSTLEPL